MLCSRCIFLVLFDDKIKDLQMPTISTTEYTRLWHPDFPHHSVRIKRTEWCDPVVAAYTGYVDAGPRHMFFYYFESRRSPATDPLLLWLTGGPGGSSAIGLLMELGPCRVLPVSSTTPTSNSGTAPHPYSWNTQANLLFLDQPAGVGFSYLDPEAGGVRGTSEEAAKDVFAFLHAFLEGFGMQGRDFHISGESYAGRYIPVYASYIIDSNRRAAFQGLQPINLKSVLIGNGYTDVPTMLTSYYDLACLNVSVPPYLDISQCVRMKPVIPRCEQMLRDGCVTVRDELGCGAARAFCESELWMPTWKSGRNPYNVAEICPTTDNPVVSCYPIMQWMSAYLNLISTLSLLGVDEHAKEYYVTGLLERGMDVLIYVGTYDNVCNWVGNSRWVEALEWTGQLAFNSRDLTEWTVHGRRAGLTKHAKGLTFATVDAAGHMVPYDKPVEALAMLNRWLEKRSLHQGE
ncbi:alpha/beta-hydrolase [Dacryopinax primogenitus]|uniref:Carboxypeptidase n=1 Tax=Dacryopinax primogenitus (strain DJM 731) TaxID=1858805 RepID=M5G6T1_DACPD|nr:alpha/beta-hydrolase [Dacryopinax primogenitus]EJU01527.1 alpha/beta-hydrolase [Dacryopinax primogenitus]